MRWLSGIYHGVGAWMAGWNGIGAGGKLAAGAGVGAVVAAVVVAFWPLPPDAPAIEAVAVAPVAATPVAIAPVAVEPKPQPETAVPPVFAQPAPPRFDVVRIEKDGASLVAGVAVPNSTVFVMVDATTVSTVVADGAGGFAALFSLPPSAQPRLITLRMRLADGAEIASDEQVIVSPADVVPQNTPSLPLAVAGLATDTPIQATPDQAAPTISVEAPPAEPAPAAILLGPEGVRVLQTGTAPQSRATQAVVIDAISYTASGAVLLGGRGMAGAVVRIYLQGRYITEFTVGPDGGWGGELPDVAPGIHTLRADQIDAAAKVTARFETPFQRETPAALAALKAPAVIAERANPVANPAPPKLASAPSVTDAAPKGLTSPTPPTVPSATAPVTIVPTPPPLPAGMPVTVTVQPGFTLWAIARDQLGDGVQYVQVYAANKDRIRDPDLIYPGQVFAMPQSQP